MDWHQSIQYATVSDIGFRRQNNQDACLVKLATGEDLWSSRGHVFVVADGMGGHAVGDLAAKIAIDTIPHLFHKVGKQSAAEALKSAIESANTTIYQRGSQNRDFHSMGTTCTTLVLCPDGAVVGHVGDSRCYRIRGSRIDQLTKDHSLFWEMIERRRIKPTQADQFGPRNVITRSLGPVEKVDVDIEGPYPTQPGDTYVLCSDGLTNNVSDAEIGAIARSLPPAEATKTLVHLSNLRGGQDNITVVIVRVAGDAPAPPAFEATSWGTIPWTTFLQACFLSISVIGLSVGTLLHQAALGAVMVGLSLLGALLTLMVSKRMSPEVVEPTSDRTVLWRPYRTASAELSTKLMDNLSKLEVELERAARKENWKVDWPSHAAAKTDLQAAREKSQADAALSAVAKALDALMAGVQEYRRELHHSARWGKQKPAPPPPSSSSSPPVE